MWRATARWKLVCACSSAVVLCAAAAAMSGCGVTGRAGAQTASRTVNVTERDFHISAPKQLAAGDVRLSVHNAGPDRHELLVARLGGNAPLPIRPDGLTVDEDRIQAATLGTLEPGAPESVRQLSIHLTPGRYVLFCNMSGHYLGGMHSYLVVK
jgi:uncharacterized cupredoxin-like copper-binding protein